jgi:tetratricopeptide (TPR) repeat protein
VHAAIECSVGRWLLRDQGSVNGTFVNNRRVKDHELAHGDVIRIGTLELTFELEEVGGHPDRTEDFADSLHDPGPPPTMPVPVPDASNPSMAGRAIAKALSQQPTAPAPPPPPPLLPDPTAKGQIARAAPRPAPPPPGAHRPHASGVELEFDPARATTRKGPRYRRQSTGFFSRRINQVTLGIVALVMIMLCGKVGLDTVRALVGSPSRGNKPSLAASPSTPGLDAATDAEVARMMSDGMRYFAEGKHFDAAAQFYKVMQLDAANVDAKRMGYVACESIALGEMRRVLGSRSASQQQREEARRLALASVAAALAGDSSAANARARVEEALALSPGDAELTAAEGALSARAAQQSAYAVRARSEKQAKSLQQLVDAGQREMERGQYAKAAKYFEQVLSGDPTRTSTQYYQAEEGIRQAKDQMKAEGKKAYASALQSMKSGDWLGARSQLQATLRADPYNEAAQAKLLQVKDKLHEQAEDYYTEARTLEGINQPEKALALYQKVMTYVADEGDPLSKKAKARMDALLQ